VVDCVVGSISFCAHTVPEPTRRCSQPRDGDSGG
jgi:hypothetical protein